MDATQPNIHELIRKAGFKVKWVAEQLEIRVATLYQGRWAAGNLNPLEIDRLAEVLRLPREQVEAAVRESARRSEVAKAEKHVFDPTGQPSTPSPDGVPVFTPPATQPKGGAA